MTETIKLLELFSGIQSQEKALAQIGIPYESVGVCDCDKDVLVASAAMRFVLEKEIENYDFPDTETMIKEPQDKNIGYSFEKKKHTITSRTPISKLKQYYISDKILKNLGDISKVEKLPKSDLLTYSAPCVDFSVAGRLDGAKNICDKCGHKWEIDFSNPESNSICPNCGNTNLKSTRSGLLGQVQRLLGIAKENDTLPKYLLLENVKNLVGKKFKPQFDAWIKYLDSIGYNTYYKVLNSKNYSIPQNRERVFAISIRKDIDTNGFTFPEPIPLTTRLKDILEINVDDKYYLPDERIEKLLNLSKNTNTEPFVVASRGRNPENPSDRTTGAPTEQRSETNFSGTTNCLTSVAKDNYICEPVIIEDFYKSREARIYSETAPTLRSERIGLEVAEEFPCSTRGKQVASAIRASIYKQGARNIEENIINGLGYEGVVEKEQPITRWRIRKLTPVECWRLMGFTDEDYNRAAQYVSASARYKQAGNSIVVNTLVSLFSSLLVDNGYKSEIWTKYITDFTDKSH